MLLAQGRFWRSGARKGAGTISLELRRAALPEDLQELRDLRIEVPLDKWNLVLKHANSDRKLLGGLLLDFAVVFGRPLRWDPQAEQIIGDDEAESLLKQVAYRKPWQLVAG